MTDTLSILTFGVWTAVAQAVLYGLLLTVAVQIALRLLPPANASTRFAVWFATLGVVAILPAAMLVSSLDLRPREAVPLPAPKMEAVATAAPTVTLAAAHEEFVPARRAVRKKSFQARIPLEADFATFFLLVWAAGVLALLGRLGVSFARVRRMKERSLTAPPEVHKRFEQWMFLAPTRRRVRLLLSAK